MKIPQLSVFLENKPGQLSRPCRELANAGINIITLSLADTKQFGILRLIVRDWRKAQQVLEAGGHVVQLAEVLAIDIAHRPGGMAETLEIIERLELNIEYMYAVTGQHGDAAAAVFRFDNPDAALAKLQSEPVKIITDIAGL
jgi:hypothetical protein